MNAENSGETAANAKIWHAGTLTYTAAGLAALFCFLLIGDFVWSLKDRAIGTIALVLFKRHGASDFLNGLLIMSIPAALGVLVSPIVSCRSDRHRGRLGRRIPYLMVTTPVAVLGMAGMAFSVEIGGALAKLCGGVLAENTAILIALGTFWMLFEFAMVIAAAVFNAFINDVVPHEMLGRFYGAFRIISLGAGILFLYWLLGWAETHAAMLFLGIGAFYGLGMLLMCLRVREGEYPPPPPPSAAGSLGGIAEYFRDCFGQRYYLLLFMAVMLCNLVFVPVNTYCIFYAQSLGISLKRYGEYMSYSFVGSFVLAWFLGVLADRFHPLRGTICTVGLYGLLSVAAFCGISGEATFAAALIGQSVICGAYTTISASLLLRLLPQDRFAQFNSASGILNALANIVAVPVFGYLMDKSGSNYRLLFLFAAALAAAAVALALIFYRQFVKHGGPDHYRAP